MIAQRSPSSRRRIALIAALIPLLPSVGRAQPASSLGEPLVVVNVAGVDRVLEDVRWVFESIDRPDLVDGIGTVLNAVNDLQGIDRTKPLGAMAFAVPTGDRQPLVVGYVPVTNLDDLMASLTVGPIRPEKVPGTTDRWRLAGPENPEAAVFLEAKNGYAWIVRDPKHFEVAYPDPVTTNAALTERYDLAVSFNIAAIPVGLRFLATAGLRNAAPKVDGDPNDPRTKLQQRALDGALKFADRFLNEGRDVVLGWDVSKSRGEVVAEFAVNAREGSGLAKSFEGFAGAPSRFAGVLVEDAPLTTAVSWRMDDETRSFLADAIAVGRERALAEAGDDANGSPLDAVRRVFDVLAATVAAGHVEAFVQATGSPPGGMTVLGAVSVEEGEKLLSLYEHLDGLKRDGTLTKNAETYGGVTLHRFVPNAENVNDRRVFGGSPIVHVGGDARTFWFSMGGKKGLNTLQRAIDSAAKPATPPGEARPLAYIDAGAATMMLLGDERNPEFDAIAQKAFLAGGDRIGLSIGPKSNGVAVKLQLGEGWVRLAGLAAAKVYDERR